VTTVEFSERGLTIGSLADIFFDSKLTIHSDWNKSGGRMSRHLHFGLGVWKWSFRAGALQRTR
jgi:hypothetical protein